MARKLGIPADGRSRSAAKWAALLALALLAGCSLLASDSEMPENDAAGTDRLKPSPCACDELDHRPEGYEWLG